MISDNGMGILRHHYESDDGSLGAHLRLNCMSQRIRQLFHRDHRHHRRLFGSGAAITVAARLESSPVSAETRPHTAPGSRRKFGDTEEVREVDGVERIGKALSADVPMTDAEIKAYLIAQHERNMRVRMRRARTKGEADVDLSPSDSETGSSSSRYESSRSSGRIFVVDPESQRKFPNHKSGRMTRSSPERRNRKTEAPKLKHKGKFYIEKTLWALEKTRTNSTDDVVDGKEEQEEEKGESATLLRPLSPLSHNIHIPRSETPLSPFQFPSQDVPISSLHSPLQAHPPTPTTQLAPLKRPSANHKKSSSTSSKLSSYISSSADLFDATRRDLQSTLRKNAEVLSGRLPLDWREKIIDDDSDSDESFYCIGESHEERFAELDAARRLSGQGEDPWTEGTGHVCRLCKKAGPRGLRGLCSECKEEFRRPTTKIFGESGDQEGARQARPPLPLKFRGPVNVLSQSSPVKSAGSDLYTEAQVVEFSKASVRPVLVGRNGRARVASPGQHISQFTALQGRELSPESPTSFETWQSSEVRAAYKTHEETHGQWPPALLEDGTPRPHTPVTSKFSESTTLLTPPTSKSGEGTTFTPTTSKASECDAGAGGDEEELLAQEKKRKWKGKGVDRSESFYSFYDELLKNRDAVLTSPI